MKDLFQLFYKDLKEDFKGLLSGQEDGLMILLYGEILAVLCGATVYYSWLLLN